MKQKKRESQRPSEKRSRQKRLMLNEMRRQKQTRSKMRPPLSGTGPRKPPNSEKNCDNWLRQNERRKRLLKLTEKRPLRKRKRRQRQRRKRRVRPQTRQERPVSPRRSSILRKCG